MLRTGRIVVCVALFCPGVSTPVFAEPIQVTSGTMMVEGFLGPAWISIAGTQGFSLDARVTPLEGYIGPLHTECYTSCEPGATIGVDAFQGGPSFFGTATFSGMTFTLDSSVNSPGDVWLEFSGQATLPGDADAPTVVTAPFTARGGVSDIATGTAALIRAAGFVSLWLSPIPPGLDLPQGWTVDQVRYDFSAAPAPIPEPTTMLLVGTGLAVAAFRGRRRRSGQS